MLPMKTHPYHRPITPDLRDYSYVCDNAFKPRPSNKNAGLIAALRVSVCSEIRP